MPLTYFHNLVKLTDHLKENLLANCQVLAIDASYAAGKMCDVDLLVTDDQARSCDPTMALEDQLDRCDGWSLTY